jgi:hypothetical protein
LGGRAPSEYRGDLDTPNESAILARALTPDTLFDDNYENFTAERAEKLVEAGAGLIA